MFDREDWRQYTKDAENKGTWGKAVQVTAAEQATQRSVNGRILRRRRRVRARVRALQGRDVLDLEAAAGTRVPYISTCVHYLYVWVGVC